MPATREHSFFQRNIFPVLLVLIVLAICLLNYIPNTSLTGWDNFQIEDNLWLNFKRSIFSVWEEFQGVGVVAGLAHSVDLVRVPFMLVLKILLPHSFVRYAFVFLCLVFGPLGMYFLVHKLLKSRKHPQTNLVSFRGTFVALRGMLVAFLGALFYLLNLATLQNFYVPTEMFIVQYAMYPWLFLVLINFLKSGESTPHPFFWFVLVNILAIPMAYAPALFIVYLLLAGCFLINYIATSKFSKKSIKKSFSAVFTILVLNSFWLLPFAYFTATTSSQVISAKNNALFSERAFLNNKAFGDWKNVSLLKGFWFNYTDLDVPGSLELLMGDWVEYTQQTYVLVTGYILIAIVLVGAVYTAVNIPKWRIALLLLLFGSYFSLANQNPPFGFIFAFLRSNSSLFREGFRLVFTKWSLAGAVSYSLLFSVGVLALFQSVSRIFTSKKLQKVGYFSIAFVLTSLLIVFTFPFFQGKLIYNKLRVSVPSEYQQLREFFSKQDPNTRIAVLPQHTFTSWKYYDWGYRGSGFLWYGIEQPILDRAFDPWSEKNEAYYRELNYAIYSQNAQLLRNVLEKYQVEWIVLDKYLLSTEEDQTILWYPQLEQLLDSVATVSLVQSSNSMLTVYRVDTSSRISSFVYAPESYIETNSSYRWAYKDQIYNDYGTYTLRSGAVSYALPSLVGEMELANEYITLDGTDGGYSVSLPENVGFTGEAYDQVESAFPVRVSATSFDNATTLLNFDYILPVSGYEGYSFTKTLPGVGNYVSVAGVVVSIGGDPVTVWLDSNAQADVSLFSLPEDAESTQDISLLSFSSDVASWTLPTPGQKYSVEVENSFIRLTGRNSVPVAFTPLSSLITFPANSKNTALLRVNFDYQIIGADETEVEPRYCLFNCELSECLNTFPTQEFVPISTEDFENILFHFVLEASSLEEEASIFYRNLSLSFAPTTYTDTVAPDTGDFAGRLFLKEIKIPSKFAQLESASTVDEYSYQNGVFSALPHKFGYLLSITSRNVSGEPSRICWQNLVSKQCSVYTDLPRGGIWQQSHYVIPPYVDGGEGYVLVLDTKSTGTEDAVNQLNKVEIRRFPYNWLKSLRSSFSTSLPHVSSDLSVLSVKKYNPSFYKVEVSGSGLLVLSQAYEEGWVAFGKKSLHLLVNNWANGWMVDGGEGGTVFLVFWPQLLQFAGFGLVFGYLSYLFYKFYPTSH